MNESYFDITTLYPTLEALGFDQGKKMMQFWADHQSLVARLDENGKSTIKFNTRLPIYTVPWAWLKRYSAVNQARQQLIHQKLVNRAAILELRKNYRHLAKTEPVKPFNTWLRHGLMPQQYLRYHKEHQCQRIEVSAFPPEGFKVTDLLAALGKFSLYAMYQGVVINLARMRVQPNPMGVVRGLDLSAQLRSGIVDLLNQPLIGSVIVISHVGIYAGDIYEFNGAQYLGTWNTQEPQVSIKPLSYLVPSENTQDPSAITVTNATFRTFRQRTGQGRDFLALSPIELIRYPKLLPFNLRGDYVD